MHYIGSIPWIGYITYIIGGWQLLEEATQLIEALKQKIVDSETTQRILAQRIAERDNLVKTNAKLWRMVKKLKGFQTFEEDEGEEEDKVEKKDEEDEDDEEDEEAEEDEEDPEEEVGPGWQMTCWHKQMSTLLS